MVTLQDPNADSDGTMKCDHGVPSDTNAEIGLKWGPLVAEIGCKMCAFMSLYICFVDLGCTTAIAATVISGFLACATDDIKYLIFFNIKIPTKYKHLDILTRDCKDYEDFDANSPYNFLEFVSQFSELTKKEIERPEALDIDEFSSLHEGISLQNLDQLCHVSYTQDDKTFTSQAWNRLFRIQEQVIREYVLEFLSSFTFKEHIAELDNVDTMVFQLGGIIRSRHSGKEKVTLDDLFLLYSIDGGDRVDVPLHVTKFFANKAKGYKKNNPIVGAYLIGKIATSYGLMTLRALRSVILGPETSLLSVAKLVDLGICRYNGLGFSEMVNDLPEDGENKAANVRVGEGQDDEGGTDEGGAGKVQAWNTDHLSQLLSFHHIDHTRYDGTPYSYVPQILDLGVQHGVDFMSNTPIYSTAPSSSPNPFGLFGDTDAGPSTSQNQGNDMDKE
ncbi:hypothetical protein Tco_0947079 [Tanacetum coccineum]